MRHILHPAVGRLSQRPPQVKAVFDLLELHNPYAVAGKLVSPMSGYLHHVRTARVV